MQSIFGQVLLPLPKIETDAVRCPFLFFVCVNDFESEARGACWATLATAAGGG